MVVTDKSLKIIWS